MVTVPSGVGGRSTVHAHSLPWCPGRFRLTEGAPNPVPSRSRPPAVAPLPAPTPLLPLSLQLPAHLSPGRHPPSEHEHATRLAPESTPRG